MNDVPDPEARPGFWSLLFARNPYDKARDLVNRDMADAIARTQAEQEKLARLEIEQERLDSNAKWTAAEGQIRESAEAAMKTAGESLVGNRLKALADAVTDVFRSVLNREAAIQDYVSEFQREESIRNELAQQRERHAQALRHETELRELSQHWMESIREAELRALEDGQRRMSEMADAAEVQREIQERAEVELEQMAQGIRSRSSYLDRAQFKWGGESLVDSEMREERDKKWSDELLGTRREHSWELGHGDLLGERREHLWEQGHDNRRSHDNQGLGDQGQGLRQDTGEREDGSDKQAWKDQQTRFEDDRRRNEEWRRDQEERQKEMQEREEARREMWKHIDSGDQSRNDLEERMRRARDTA